MNNKAIAIVSGGMDSVTMLYHMITNAGYNVVQVLTFDYGQKHSKEIYYAEYHAKNLNIPWKLINLKGILKGSSLTDHDSSIPKGHYEDESMKQTVVPNRNMIMLSIAVSIAQSIDVYTICYGVHSGDHAIYPDCRPEFVNALDRVCNLGNYNPISIQAPFILLNKKSILQHGIELNVDYGKTWTCYVGEEKACGKCGSCVERLEAFESLGVSDPLRYV